MTYIPTEFMNLKNLKKEGDSGLLHYGLTSINNAGPNFAQRQFQRDAPSDAADKVSTLVLHTSPTMRA